MKLTIDTEHKTIKIDEPVTMGAFVQELSTMLGNDWNKYTLVNKEVSQASMFGGLRSTGNSTSTGVVTTTNPGYYSNNPIPFSYAESAEVTNTIADGNR